MPLALKSRLQAYERAAGRCERCGGEGRPKSEKVPHRLEAHHINRRRDRGSDGEENLIVLCHDCHNSDHRRERVTRWRRSECEIVLDGVGVQLKIPREVHKRLKVRAAEQETTITELILKAVRETYGLGCLV